MKFFFRLVCSVLWMVVLGAGGPAAARAEGNPRYFTFDPGGSGGGDSRVTAVYCVPPSNLSKVADFYEDRFEDELRGELSEPRVTIRFLRSSAIRIGTTDNPESGVIQSGLGLTMVNGTPIMTGELAFMPCRIAMPVSITVRSAGETGGRVSLSTRSTVIVTGYLSFKKTSATNIPPQTGDVYEY